MTAEEQLARWLWLIPAAAGEEGADLEALGRRLGRSVEDVVGDVEALTARQFYLPAGEAEDLQILIDEGRLWIWTKGEFRRPARLRPREALALGLALRTRAAAAAPERAAHLRELAGRLEAQLSAADMEELRRAHAVDLGRDRPGVRDTLERATRERRRCRIDYLKPGAPGPDERVLRSYALVHVHGAWYALGWCERSQGLRAFRADRVVRAELLDDGFDEPADFDVEHFLSGGRVFSGGAHAEAMVRYAPEIARWILEHEGSDERAERHPDGSVVLRHPVADPEWLIRHVLGYAGAAELLAPEELRRTVARRAAELAGS